MIFYNFIFIFDVETVIVIQKRADPGHLPLQ
ncbi:hypothetical protein [Limosilactobacillus fermentum]